MTDLDMFDWQSQSNDSSQLDSMMVDEDYMELMSDTLFSTISSNQPFAFPDTREIGNFYELSRFSPTRRFNFRTLISVFDF